MNVQTECRNNIQNILGLQTNLNNNELIKILIQLQVKYININLLGIIDYKTQFRYIKKITRSKDARNNKAIAGRD